MVEAFSCERGWISVDNLKKDEAVTGASGTTRVTEISLDPECVTLQSKGICIDLPLSANVFAPNLKSVQDLTPDTSVIVSVQHDTADADIPDELLTFTGWLLTDGAFDRGQFRVYQNVEKMAPVMRAIEACNFHRNTFGIDDRIVDSMKGQSILGRVSISTMHAHRVSDALQLTNKRIAPSWLFSLSRRQLDLLIMTLALGDGSVIDGLPRVLYGYASLMHPLQVVLATRGYRTKLTLEDRENARINVTDTRKLNVTPAFHRKPCWRVTAPEPVLLRSGGGVILVQDSQ